MKCRVRRHGEIDCDVRCSKMICSTCSNGFIEGDISRTGTELEVGSLGNGYREIDRALPIVLHTSVDCVPIWALIVVYLCIIRIARKTRVPCVLYSDSVRIRACLNSDGTAITVYHNSWRATDFKETRTLYTAAVLRTIERQSTAPIPRSEDRAKTSSHQATTH